MKKILLILVSALVTLTAASQTKEAYTISSTPVYRDWETDRKSTRLNSSH